MTLKFVMQRLQELAQSARGEEGQALVEYALLLSLIAVVCFVSVQAFGLGVSHLYSKINSVYP